MRVWMVLKAVLSVWAVALPVRFIIEYFNGGIYKPCLFDVFFDWIPLLVFGWIVFLESIHRFYKSHNGFSKGLAPVVAELLLLLIVVGVCVLTYGFITSWMKNMFSRIDALTDEFNRLINQSVEEFKSRFWVVECLTD